MVKRRDPALRNMACFGIMELARPITRAAVVFLHCVRTNRMSYLYSQCVNSREVGQNATARDESQFLRRGAHEGEAPLQADAPAGRCHVAGRPPVLQAADL